MDHNPLLFNNCVIVLIRFILVLFCCFSVGYRTKRNCSFVFYSQGRLGGGGGLSFLSLNYVEMSVFGDGA